MLYSTISITDHNHSILYLNLDLKKKKKRFLCTFGSFFQTWASLLSLLVDHVSICSHSYCVYVRERKKIVKHKKSSMMLSSRNFNFQVETVLLGAKKVMLISWQGSEHCSEIPDVLVQETLYRILNAFPRWQFFYAAK